MHSSSGYDALLDTKGIVRQSRTSKGKETFDTSAITYPSFLAASEAAEAVEAAIAFQEKLGLIFRLFYHLFRGERGFDRCPLTTASVMASEAAAAFAPPS